VVTEQAPPMGLSPIGTSASIAAQAPSLHRSYRLPQYYEPLRHPSQPGRSLTSCQLIRTAITAGTSRVAYGPLCLHAVANTPAGLMEFVRSYDSISFGLPRNRGGSAPALVFSRPAQRLLTLRPARSPSRLATLCTRGFSSFVASTAALIATGWSEPVPGRVYLPLWTTTFHGAPGNPTNQKLCHSSLKHAAPCAIASYNAPQILTNFDRRNSNDERRRMESGQPLGYRLERS
jgi:hypothetical protein